MQKLLHVLFLACLTFTGLQNKAQTLTAANFNPQIGEVFTHQASDYVSPGSSGQGQVWDFSKQSNYYQATIYSIINPTASSFPATFTMATVARKRSSSFKYYTTNANGIDLVGAGDYGSNPIVTTYTNNETLIKYPFTFGDTYSDSWACKIANSAITTTNIGVTSLTADGSGTLITGCATYTNVLRIHSVTSYTSFVQSTISTTIYDTYSWYTPGVYCELVSLSLITATSGTDAPITSKQCNIYNDPSNPIGIKKNSLNPTTFLIYPNPASNELNIKTLESVNGNCCVKIFNSTGQLLIEKNSTLENGFTFDVSSLQTGIYFATIKTEDKLVETKKVIITR